MAEAGSKGLFRSILATLDLVGPEDNVILDAILMVALADGGFSQAERDAVAWLIAAGELPDTDWSEVQPRAELLATEAPFFAESRARLARARWPEGTKPLALRLAAKVGTAGQPLDDEQRALWSSLAEGLGINEAERRPLLPTWGTAVAPPGAIAPHRPAFSSPDQVVPINLFDALARARDDELRVLMFKLTAPRDLASLRLESAQITEVGTIMEMGDHTLRIDAVIESPEQEWWVRCLAAGEALYPVERNLLPTLVTTLAAHQRLAFVHEGPLWPPDAQLLGELDPDKIVVLAL